MARRAMDAFCSPQSVAVVGASSSAGTVGNVIIQNLAQAEHPPEIYPVNPKGGEILGFKAYPSLGQIEKEVDLAILAIRPESILDAIKDCARAGIKQVIITTSGFAETSEEGRKRQERVVALARRNGMRLMGPNTVGNINMERGLRLMTLPHIHEIEKGPVSFICQSPTFPFQFMAHRPEIGLNKMIDVGNVCDVDHADALAYLGDDPSTEVIVLHIEGVRDGKRLLEVASRVTLRKPVIALKTGRTPSGRKAASSHTGSLTGRDEVYEAAFRQAGIFRANDIDDMLDHAAALAALPAVKGRRVGILTATGGAGTMAADACFECGLEVTELSPGTIERIKQAQPEWVSIGNPVDVWQAIYPTRQEVMFATALDALAAAPEIDAIAITTPVIVTPLANMVNVLRDYCEKGVPKPTVLCNLGTEGISKELASLSTKGLVLFPGIERAIRALAVSYTYERRRRGDAF